MNVDRLEYEVRLLPRVVACSITDSLVSVLLDPRGDPDAVAVAVSGILITAGLDRPVRVMGGTPGVTGLPHRRLAAPAGVGASIGVGVLALATAVAALAGAGPFNSGPSHPEARSRANTTPTTIPKQPDLVHLTIRPAAPSGVLSGPAGNATNAALPVNAPTVIASTGNVVSAVLAVATGPARARVTGTLPLAPLAPIPASVLPVAVTPIVPETPSETPAPAGLRPSTVHGDAPPPSGHSVTQVVREYRSSVSDDERGDRDDDDHGGGRHDAAPHRSRGATMARRRSAIEADDVVGHLRAHVRQAFCHGHG